MFHENRKRSNGSGKRQSQGGPRQLRAIESGQTQNYVSTRPLVLSPASYVGARRARRGSNVRKTWWNVRSKRREESLESI